MLAIHVHKKRARIWKYLKDYVFVCILAVFTWYQCQCTFPLISVNRWRHEFNFSSKDVTGINCIAS